MRVAAGSGGRASWVHATVMSANGGEMSRRTLWATLAVVVGAGAWAGIAGATPPAGFVGTTLAVGRYDEIDVRNMVLPPNFWQA
jgi:hypothetical protein